MPQWRLWLTRIARKIWFRATLISLLSVVLALASAALAPFIPYEFSLSIGSDAVDNILSILASSMLAVTTFSLTAMVLAYSRAAQQVTPRATELLVEDKTAQNALSSFLGAFLFAIVGIMALSTGAYGAQGRVILYAGTILLILWIVIILLRWIAVLTQFGRVEDSVARVERAALRAIESWRGPIALSATDRPMPADGHDVAVPARAMGYVTSIDIGACKRCASECGARLVIASPPGAWVAPGTPLAWSDTPLDEEVARELAKAFAIGRQRSFDSDPRFSMLVLGEIGSRALSSATNDPGTAIAVLDSGQRILAAMAEPESSDDPDDKVSHPPLSLEAMAADMVLPLARDGAPIAEVGVRLQELLGAVARLVPDARPEFRALASDALQRARSSGMAASDLKRVERAFSDQFVLAGDQPSA